METGPALAPPALIEHIVQCLVPPRAREAVVGDLREIYSTPAQYLTEAAKTVPQVLVSCAVRALNLPLLLLQFALLLFFLEKVHSQFHQLTQADIGRIGAFAVCAVILRGTYQQDGRPLAKYGILESIAVALFLMAFCQSAFGLKQPAVGTPDFDLEFQFFVALPLAVPLLGVLRTLLIVWGDRDLDRFIDSVDHQTVAHDYAKLSQKRRGRCTAEALLLLVGAVVMMELPGAAWLAGIYAAVALFMFGSCRTTMDAGMASSPTALDYRRFLRERQQIRQFLAWLWASPVLITIYDQLIVAGFSHHRTVLVSIGSASIILTCFFIASLNKELWGQVAEKTRMLESRAA